MTPKTNTKDKVKSKVHSQDSIPSFIRKTYDILEERKFPEVIDWNPEGTALVIKKPSEFCQKVLPAYFKHNNLTSFVRQLNMYNFHKRRTQNIDHVYYHELFQKGKKHLLKEIKRKNHDHTSDKTQKPVETIEPSQAGKDVSSLLYENQVLRRLYNDASTKVAVLEGQVRELTVQNQSLWAQVCQQNDRDNTFKPMMMTRAEKQTSLTQDQLPMTFGDISIPPLKLTSERQPSNQTAMPQAKQGSGNVNSYLNLSEASADSTEVSHNSPSLQTNITESEKGPEATEATTTLHLPLISLTPQISQLQIKPTCSDLFISRQDMSLGQLFEAWNQEAQNNELITFADQRTDKNPINVQALFQDPATVLGKRLFDAEQQGNGTDPRFNVPEPLAKRHELSIFSRRGMISTGTEDKEILRTILRRDSSVNEEYDPNMGVDLMDFNQPFVNCTKASS